MFDVAYCTNSCCKHVFRFAKMLRSLCSIMHRCFILKTVGRHPDIRGCSWFIFLRKFKEKGIEGQGSADSKGERWRERYQWVAVLMVFVFFFKTVEISIPHILRAGMWINNPWPLIVVIFYERTVLNNFFQRGVQCSGGLPSCLA